MMSRYMSLNLQGVMNKTQAFIQKISDVKPHVILATERPSDGKRAYLQNVHVEKNHFEV